MVRTKTGAAGLIVLMLTNLADFVGMNLVGTPGNPPSLIIPSFVLAVIGTVATVGVARPPGRGANRVRHAGGLHGARGPLTSPATNRVESAPGKRSASPSASSGSASSRCGGGRPPPASPHGLPEDAPTPELPAGAPGPGPVQSHLHRKLTLKAPSARSRASTTTTASAMTIQATRSATAASARS
jgi:hypothetical protein